MAKESDFNIEWVTPWTPSHNVTYLLDKTNFRIGLKVNTLQLFKPEDVLVNLWTNLYHKGNCEGEWHCVPATYQGVHQNQGNGVGILMYGVDLTLTCLGIYGFNYKAKHKTEKAFTWAIDEEVHGNVEVKLPVIDQTGWIQKPISNKITHNVYIGNFNAAVHAIEDGFDCLLNMADDVHIHPEQFIYPIIYKRCLLPFGADKPISAEVIEKVVRWLRFMSDHCNKVMVCSRMGHARSGSVLIAYIYFMNPDLSFEDAYAYVDRRSLVYPHKGLKDVVVSLYPRS